MIDYVLDVSFNAADGPLEEEVLARLFLSASSGSTSAEAAGTATISAYFDSAESRDAAAEMLRGLDVEIGFSERKRVDWLDLYQQSLQPIVIGERFMVAPDAKLIGEAETRLAIIVPQEQAFGTGSHETTALCMAMLESLNVREARGLDIGSGSGILAMAMVRLGARKVIAFDNDRDAYAALRDNRMRNGIADDVMPLFIGGMESLRAGSFDVVTMNIIPEVIVPLLGSVVARLRENGTLILSGILTARRSDVIEAARPHGVDLFREDVRGEWWCGAFRMTRKALAKPS